ncbi:hypothetical protein DFP72DRAFT_1057900 [Ephemerocybe angulata]|uniref:Uncharacterized protein n=1 Tax=Ephemerocybe angulata TaxID=980116 RepID=A0A8H6IJD8_9AGAR|nr:hypothetical protein DFP72DRAFT_1057900 [Tulosesus angulatus]
MHFTIFAAVPVVLAVATFATAHPDKYGLSNDARDYIDDLNTREVLSPLSVRELLDELTDRLEQRDGMCMYCAKQNVKKGGTCKQHPNGGHTILR